MVYFLLFFCVIAVDQVSKYLARLSGVAYLNDGGILGVASQVNWLLISMIALVVLLSQVKHWKSFTNIQKVGWVMLLASGISNGFDRLFFSGVWDWIVYPYINVVANLADAFLGIAFIILFVESLLRNKMKVSDEK